MKVHGRLRLYWGYLLSNITSEFNCMLRNTWRRNYDPPSPLKKVEKNYENSIYKKNVSFLFSFFLIKTWRLMVRKSMTTAQRKNISFPTKSRVYKLASITSFNSPSSSIIRRSQNNPAEKQQFRFMKTIWPVSDILHIFLSSKDSSLDLMKSNLSL